MSPRPRQVSDDDLLKATFRALSRLGPGKLTLADVAREAGVSAAAVVQRFGSKRALLLAAAADAARGSSYIFPGLRARYRLPRAALLGLAECMTIMGSTPDAVTNTMALQLDLNDAEFHRHALAGSEGMRRGLTALVREAVRAGELRPCNARRLASALQATLNGSLLNWAVHRKGSVVNWIRRDLAMVLDPYTIGVRPVMEPATTRLARLGRGSRATKASADRRQPLRRR